LPFTVDPAVREQEAVMTVIHATEQALTAANKPEWCQIERAGFFELAKEGGEHDCHYHDHNELYLICGGKAKIVNDGQEHYVRAGDIVCIKAGAEHDILEVYGEDDFQLFWLYEPGPPGGRVGHLHRSPEKARAHPVPAKSTPPDFPN
jgi:mannose-6-phosphate isomerase-like protein (cupin superfamily)